MGINLVRGQMTTTRLGVLVVPTLGSCLEDITHVGMIVKGFGSGDWSKRGIFGRYGRVLVV